MLLENRASALLIFTSREKPLLDKVHSRSGLLPSSSISVGFVGGQENREFPHPVKIESRAWGCNSIGGCLPSMHKALGSIAMITHHRGKKEENLLFLKRPGFSFQHVHSAHTYL